jgi:hypothetical protein
MKLAFVSRSIFTSLSVAASLTFVGWAAAVTVDLTPSKDNTLIESPVGNSNGAGDGIYAGRVGSLGGGTKRRGLLAFDLSSIPAGSTVDAVSLRLEMAQSPNEAARVVTLHRVSADWGEAGSTGAGSGGAAQPGDATWIYRFFNTSTWTSAGGDFTAAPSASLSVADTGPYVWTGAGLVADVQSWVNNPASNFGWLVLGNESTTSTVKKFYSSEGLTPPRLTVDYTPGTISVPPGPAEAVWFAPPWPSPASGSVNLSYTLPQQARVSLSIQDAMGRVVRRLASGVVAAAGRYATIWDGRTDSGTRAPSGVYLARLVVDKNTYQRRMTMLR